MTKRTISTQRAQEIASHWHGGQWSAFYQFSSSGCFIIENVLQYFKELLADMEPEYWSLHPVERKVYEMKELRLLERFFHAKATELNVAVEYGKSEQYGYLIPFIKDETPDDIASKVNTISYPR